MPPRIFAHELHVDMPCSIDAYMARTAADCYISAKRHFEKRPLSLTDVIVAFQQDQPSRELCTTGEINTLCLFVIIFGKYFLKPISNCEFF